MGLVDRRRIQFIGGVRIVGRMENQGEDLGFHLFWTNPCPDLPLHVNQGRTVQGKRFDPPVSTGPALPRPPADLERHERVRFPPGLARGDLFYPLKDLTDRFAEYFRVVVNIRFSYIRGDQRHIMERCHQDAAVHGRQVHVAVKFRIHCGFSVAAVTR